MNRMTGREVGKALGLYCANASLYPLAVDIGSRDYNGSLRQVVQGRGLAYVGLDIEAGPNVDRVMTSEYRTGIDASVCDVVLSVSVLEHCRNPFRLVDEMRRIVKPGGLIVLAVPRRLREHRYPIDCWRILPDGMRALLDYCGFEVQAAYSKPFGILGQYAMTFGVGVAR